jgi:hypothetical protein
MKAIAAFIKREPVRVGFMVRLAFYVGFALYAGAALDADILLELVLGVIGVAVADGLKTENTRQQTVPVKTADELGAMSAAGQTGAFVAELLRAQVSNFLPGATLAKAVAAVLPSIGSLLSQSLTPERQREVTGKVHAALRNANLIRRVDL